MAVLLTLDKLKLVILVTLIAKIDGYFVNFKQAKIDVIYHKQ